MDMKLEQNDHIVFAGGGTAGHLFPGLAVAEQLLRFAPGMRITFVGTGKPFETRYVKRAGFDYVALPCQPFPRLGEPNRRKNARWGCERAQKLRGQR